MSATYKVKREITIDDDTLSVFLGPDFTMMSDTDKAAVFCVWLLTVTRGSEVPACPECLRKAAGLEHAPRLAWMAANGLLDRIGVEYFEFDGIDTCGKCGTPYERFPEIDKAMERLRQMSRRPVERAEFL